jgi:hypothetical protein
MGRICRTWGNGEVYTGIWWRELWEGDHLANPGVVERILLKYILKKCDGEVWTGLISSG